MTELELYRKMYATVVHEADQILQDLPKALTNPDCGRDDLFKFGERLKQALLDAEEIYLSVEEEEEDDGLTYVNESGIQSLGDCVKAACESVCAGMAGSEKLAQAIREKFEDDMRKWKEELRESEEDDF